MTLKKVCSEYTNSHGNSWWWNLMDATYKTTRYDLPLFFISVRTNTRYCVVDVVQSESLTTSKKLFKFCKNGTPIGIQSFSWPTILRQKLELWRHLSQVLLFTSAIFIESRPEKGGFVTRNTAWVVKMLNGFLISSVPVHGHLHPIPVRRNHKTTTSSKPRMPSKAQTCGRRMNLCVQYLAKHISEVGCLISYSLGK